MRNWLFGVSTNIGLLLILSAIGFGWMAYFNSITIKLYGDHCVYDSDCALDMNYICQNGVCNCTSTSYYNSARLGCGKVRIFYFFYININQRFSTEPQCSD